MFTNFGRRAAHALGQGCLRCRHGGVIRRRLEEAAVLCMLPPERTRESGGNSCRTGDVVTCEGEGELLCES